jgi:CDP-glycerol glycerophosphotransferase (TagB/SpsB family)
MRIIIKAIMLFIDIITFLYPIKNNRITFLSRGFSGSNTFAFKKSKYYDSLVEKYDVFFVNESKGNSKNLLDKVKKYYNLSKLINTSKIIVSTHGGRKRKKNTINIDLWHGVPLKTMRLMDKNEKNKSFLKNTDYLASNNDFNSTILNACFGLSTENYIQIGNPRNDLLINSDGLKNLSTLFGNGFENKKKIFVFPTYRSRKKADDGEYNYENFFGFDRFEYKSFNEFLKSQNIVVFIKLHPNDEEKVLNKIEKNSVENIKVITGKILKDNNIDLYEILNSCDLLITDYSSIYFDFLILDRPIIFNPVDLNTYRKKRGFLLEPYDFWTPGPKVYNQEDLERAIINSFQNDEFAEKRKVINKLINGEKKIDSNKLLYDFINNKIGG